METFTLKCLYCGVEFESKYSKAKYHHPKCRLKHWRENNKGAAEKVDKRIEEYLRERFDSLDEKMDILIRAAQGTAQKPDEKVHDNYLAFSQMIANANTLKELLDTEDMVRKNMFLTKAQRQEFYSIISQKIQSL